MKMACGARCCSPAGTSSAGIVHGGCRAGPAPAAAPLAAASATCRRPRPRRAAARRLPSLARVLSRAPRRRPATAGVASRPGARPRARCRPPPAQCGRGAWAAPALRPSAGVVTSPCGPRPPTELPCQEHRCCRHAQMARAVAADVLERMPSPCWRPLWLQMSTRRARRRPVSIRSGSGANEGRGRPPPRRGVRRPGRAAAPRAPCGRRRPRPCTTPERLRGDRHSHHNCRARPRLGRRRSRGPRVQTALQARVRAARHPARMT
mmetsp:Transcript_73700/g.240038  ORF Transcript_73700/g.240038 Transcript_73700/m.240038 type:complete len:264 (+) Transcript_73700:710-1501(+)